jgi:L-alanine-DL-glutamate epimerase-like enolase superfamily enzyme
MVNGIGKAFWLRSTWELGVSGAAMCQLALAVPTMQRPSQTLIDWVADDLLINSDWQIEQGVVRPVYKAGFGVELNRTALEHYATKS